MDNITEAEAMTDYGELVFRDAEIEFREDLEADRERRRNLLKGRYVIVCDGRNGTIFLQDSRISNKCYWTKFVENAISFTNKVSAEYECCKLRYNNPREALLDNQLRLHIIGG
jgi:hypothetical protein